MGNEAKILIPPPQADVNSATLHRVKEGETLKSIATKFCLTQKALRRANPQIALAEEKDLSKDPNPLKSVKWIELPKTSPLPCKGNPLDRSVLRPSPTKWTDRIHKAAQQAKGQQPPAVDIYAGTSFGRGQKTKSKAPKATAASLAF